MKSGRPNNNITGFEHCPSRRKTIKLLYYV